MVLNGTIWQKNENLIFILQNIYDLHSKETLYREILTRLPDRSESREMASFFHRLPAQEHSDILEHQLQFVDNHNDGKPFGVNVHSNFAKKDTLPGIIENFVARSGFDPSNLYIELVENCLPSEESSQTKLSRQLEKIKKLGCRIVVDDFGSSFSNIDFISHYIDYIDLVKIDGKLFKKATKNKHDAFLLSSIVAYLEYFEIGVVAEHMETEEALEYAERIDIGFGQGFLFGSC